MIERRVKAAKFPATKSLDSFDFKAIPKLNKMQVLELARCEWIDRRENVIALGPSGTAKAAPERPKPPPDHTLQNWPTGPMRHRTRQLSGERTRYGAWHHNTGLLLHRHLAGFVSAVDILSAVALAATVLFWL